MRTILNKTKIILEAVKMWIWRITLVIKTRNKQVKFEGVGLGQFK